MKKLTQEEFSDRTQAVLLARKIFMPHLTKNISIAFEIYQKILAENNLKLTLARERERDYGILATLQRPLCPSCGKELALRLINIPQGKKNLFGHKSAWICEDQSCAYEEFSSNTLSDWLNILPKKEKENGTR